MTESVVDYNEQPLAVEVDATTMIFNMASDSLTSLKECFIKLAKHELFFEEFRALKHISFDIHRGEVVGLVGTNGSGKSTMLKIIAGVLEPSEGSVKVHGNIAPLIELGAGFDPELTARENIYLNVALVGYTKEFIDADFDGIIEFVELQNFVDIPLKNFSSGMVARIAFAIATITEPDILIVDEMLSVGDVFFQQKCEARIQHFIQSGDVAVLFVSHSMEQVERICQRAFGLRRATFVWTARSMRYARHTANSSSRLYLFALGGLALAWRVVICSISSVGYSRGLLIPRSTVRIRHGAPFV